MLFNVPIGELAVFAVALVGAGALTGVLAGVFGVGGGALIVPVLYELFRFLGTPEEVRMAVCVGTSLAIIVPTSLRSFQAHKARGTVDMQIIRDWAVPCIVGVVLGAIFARYASPVVFKIVFVCVALLNSVRLLFDLPWRFGTDMPKGPLMKAYGFIIGLLSSLMGIGGGQISTMIMTFYNRPIHQAVSTSAGMGVLISIPGALGYMAAGFDKVGLPPLSLGYVSAIGLVLFAPVSVWTAPLGVKLAHSLAKRTLERAFGVFLLLVSLRFIASLAGY
jgi:uncharacterized membrane protein YfcA